MASGTPHQQKVHALHHAIVAVLDPLGTGTPYLDHIHNAEVAFHHACGHLYRAHCILHDPLAGGVEGPTLCHLLGGDHPLAADTEQVTAVNHHHGHPVVEIVAAVDDSHTAEVAAANQHYLPVVDDVDTAEAAAGDQHHVLQKLLGVHQADQICS